MEHAAAPGTKARRRAVAAQGEGRGARVKIVTVIPTYNEAGNVGALIDALLAQPFAGHSMEVLIVDDASPDGTADRAAAAGGRWPGRVEVLRRRRKDGLSAAYVAGFERALESGAGCIVQMDADGSHDPATIAPMIDALAAADVVIGSRYAPGNSLDSRAGWYRRAISRLGNRTIAQLLPLHGVSDPTSGFRAWRREALLQIDPRRRLRSHAYGLQVEMAFLAASQGCRIAEIPIHFCDRRTGRSKMTLAVQLQTIWEIASLAIGRGAATGARRQRVEASREQSVAAIHADRPPEASQSSRAAR